MWPRTNGLRGRSLIGSRAVQTVKKWRVLLHNKPAFADHYGKDLEREWREAGHAPLKAIRTGQAYFLTGWLTEEDVKRVTEKLLADPVTQEAMVGAVENTEKALGEKTALVWPKPGVADPVGDTVLMAARDLGMPELKAAMSGAVYHFHGSPPLKAVESFCAAHVYNPLIQRLELL